MDFKGVKVLLLDGFCRQNAILLKELKKLGCEITTLNSSKLDVGYSSRYPKHRIIDKRFKNDIEYYEKLIIQEVESEKYDVIFPVIEESTEILSKHYDSLSKKIKIIVPPYEAFNKAHNKQLTMELCMKNGINCPLTKMDDESLEQFCDKIKFPLAAKPRQGRGSVGFRKIKSKDELYQLIENGDIKVDEYVIQEFIDEAEIHRVSYTFIDDNGEVKSSLIAKSSRPYPLGVGTNSLFESVKMDEVADQAEKLLKLMGWRGYASVCFIENAFDGVPKVMEINGRISASFKISVLSGLSIVRQLLERAYGVEVSPMPEKIKYGKRVSHSQSGTMWFLKSPERFRKEKNVLENGFVKDIVFSLSDPMPYLTYSIQCIKKYKSEMKKRSNR